MTDAATHQPEGRRATGPLRLCRLATLGENLRLGPAFDPAGGLRRPGPRETAGRAPRPTSGRPCRLLVTHCGFTSPRLASAGTPTRSTLSHCQQVSSRGHSLYRGLTTEPRNSGMTRRRTSYALEAKHLVA